MLFDLSLWCPLDLDGRAPDDVAARSAAEVPT